MENTTTIKISNEANITGKGMHRGRNCHAVVATELFEARTSQLDMATCLHTGYSAISEVISGRSKRAGVYKRDENGNLKRVAWTRVYRANDPRAVEALLQNGKKLLAENAELKGNLETADATIADLTGSLNAVNNELAAYRAYKEQKAKVKALDAAVTELKEKLLEAVSAHNEAVVVLVELEKAL